MKRVAYGELILITRCSAVGYVSAASRNTDVDEVNESLPSEILQSYPQIASRSESFADQ